jgi:hypothetical protein
MQVFINEQEIGALSVDGATVGEVIEALSVHVPIDHIVTAVDLDGECFRAGGNEGYARRASEGVSCLHVRTQGPESLAQDLLEEVGDALQVITAKLDRVVELFAARDGRSAQTLLAVLVEELHLALVLEENVAALSGGSSRLSPSDFELVATRLVESQERGAAAETARLLADELRPLLVGAQARVAASASSSSRK